MPGLYPGLGLYRVTLTCDNQFGIASNVTVAPGVKPDVQYESHARGTDVVIAAAGANAGAFDVYVDGVPTTAGLVANSTHLVLNAALFQTVGEHSVVVKPASGTGPTLLTKIFDVVQPIATVAVSTGTAGVELGQPSTVILTVQRGDRLFVSLSYGDGQTESVYLLAGPATVTRDHVYSALGAYPVTATVANDVGSVVVSTVASVERRIVNASMTATNVTSLGQATTFSFVVDATATPQMPISVTFDYGDGSSAATVKLAPPLYVSTYTYARYGIYHVTAAVWNNVSVTSLPVSVLQVGQNITAVDLAVANPLVAVNQPVTLTISVSNAIRD